MNKHRICLIFLIALLKPLLSDEIDIGTIEVIDNYEEEYEKNEEQEKFTTIIKIKEEDEAKNLAEVLSESSEVFIKDTGGEAGISTVSIRGSSSKNVLILLDGTPLNTGGNSSIDISMIPAGSIEKIEIIRGGDAALYGSGAMGGVLNITTKKADKSFYKYTFGATSFRAVNNIFSLGKKNEGYDLFLSGQFSSDLGNFLYMDNNGTEFNTDDDSLQKRKHNEARKFSFILNQKLYFPGDMSLGFNANFIIKSNNISGPITFENHFTDAHLDTYLLNGGIDFNPGNISSFFNTDLSLNFKYDHFEYSNSQEYGGGSTYSENSLHFIKGKLNNHFYFIPSHLLQIGSEFSYESNPENPARKEAGLIIRDEWFIDDGTGGINPTIRIQYNSDLTQQIRFLWNLGLFFSPLKELKLKVNVFHAFRNPDFYELYYTYGQYVGNPDLKPETSYGGDIGFHFNTENFFIEAVFFCTDYENLIQYLLSYGFVYKPINIDEVISYGGEFRCNINIIEMISIKLSYTLNFLNNHMDLEKGNWSQLPGHPLHRLTGGIEWTRDIFTLGGDLTYEDEIGITYNGLKYIPEKILINLFGRVTFPERKGMKSTFFINGENILDVHTTDVRNYPLEGFHITLGLSLEL